MGNESDRLSAANDPANNKFRRVREKVRSPQLANDSAWREVQPFISHYLPDYPGSYSPDQRRVIRNIFDLRRDAFTRRIADKDASTQIRAMIETKDEVLAELMGRPAALIRDLFDNSAPLRRSQRP